MPNPLRAHLWQPLDVTKRQIRILVLYPSENIEDHPKGHLEIKSLDRHPVYDAISYAWGGPQRSPPLYLHGYRVPITENLHSCLRFLRHGRHPKNFWVDAICVDQNNSSERAQQVQQMEHVFRTAETVYARLGDFHSRSMSRVFQAMAQIAAGTLLKHVNIDGEPFESRDAEDLSKFTSSSWFRRLWVKQEAMLARELVLCHYHASLTISEVIQFFANQKHQQMSQMIRGELAKARWSENADLIAELKDLRDVLSEAGSSHDQKARFVVSLMDDLRVAQVHDVRDRIFGLSGIFSALFDEDLVQVNYSLSAQEVFTEFAAKLIVKTKSLSLLSQANCDENSLVSLPSWVPDWSSSYFFLSERSRFSSLYTAFNASGKKSMADPLFDKANKHLGLKGCILGRIWSVGEVCEYSGDSYLARDAKMYREFPFQYILNCIHSWKREAKNAETEYNRYNSANYARLICRSSYLEKAVNDRSTDRHIEGYHRIGHYTEAQEFLRQVRADLSRERYSARVEWLGLSISKSRFFIMSNGDAGLGPPDTQKDDFVAVMLGSRVPYVLRKGTEAGNKHLYSFVGECHVQGIMYGEAVESKDFAGFEDIWLE